MKSKVSGWFLYTPSVGSGITAELRRSVAEVSGYTVGPVLQPDGAADEMLEEQVALEKCVQKGAQISLSLGQVLQRQEWGCADVEDSGQERLEEDLGVVV